MRGSAALAVLAGLLLLWHASGAPPSQAKPSSALAEQHEYAELPEQVSDGEADDLPAESAASKNAASSQRTESSAKGGAAQGEPAAKVGGTSVSGESGSSGGGKSGGGAGSGKDAADSKLSDFQKAIGGSAGGDEKKQAEDDFVKDNPEWLKDSEAMAADFIDTPAMEHLHKGHLGDLDGSEIGFDMFSQLYNAVHSTLARCSHTGRLKLDKAGRLPKQDRTAGCGHRKLKLLFLQDPVKEVEDPLAPQEIWAALSSVNARLWAFAGQLRRRGHHVMIAGLAELDQVDLKTLDAIVVVKTLGAAFERVKSAGVPLIWDHVDYWGELPFYQLDLWEHKAAFAGVFTASRVTRAAFATANIPAHILYHNHANYPGFHRPNREPDVKVISLQGDFRTSDLDVIPALKAYTDKHGLEFRYGKYTGHGRDVAELSDVSLPAAQDWGDQLKFVMGMGSVDLAVLWPKNYGQFDVCYKPTSRVSQFASLGIPVVAYPFASYIDLFVEFGYPFVARDLEEMADMLDRLRGSGALRQEASKILLAIAKYLSVEELVGEYENGVCSFLDGAAARDDDAPQAGGGS